MQQTKKIKFLLQQLIYLDQNPQQITCQGRDSIFFSFFKDWFNEQGNQFNQMYQYAWDIQKDILFNSIFKSQNKFLTQPSQKAKEILIESDYPLEQNTLSFFSAQQIVISLKGTTSWVNPTKIPTNFQPTIILTTSNIKNLSIVLLTNNPNVITLPLIYKKLIKLQKFICDQMKKDFELIAAKLMQQFQYYPYNGLLFSSRMNFSHEPTFDMHLLVQDANDKVEVMIETCKVKEVKYIYYSWKKSHINQQLYNQLIRENPKDAIYFTQKSEPIHLKINLQKQARFVKQQFYPEFKKKQMISELQQQELIEIFNSSQLIQFTQKQVVYKKGCIFDQIFFLVKGDAILEYNPIQNIEERHKKMYGFDQYSKKGKNYTDTLVVTSQEAYFIRIHKTDIKFLLNNFY